MRVAAILASPRELAGSTAASSASLANPFGSLTCHHRRQIPVGASEHPRQARAKHVTADQHQQTGRQVCRVVGRGLAVRCQPGHRQLDPFGAQTLLGAAGQPAVLPGVARQRRQPAQQLLDTASSARSCAVGRGSERRSTQPLLHLLGRRRRVRPPLRGRSWWKFGAQLTIPPSLLGGDRGDRGQRFACAVLDDGTHNVLPNSTLNACGS